MGQLRDKMSDDLKLRGVSGFDNPEVSDLCA